MAVDKLVDSGQLDSDLTSVANAIRTKGGTSAQLAFPQDFITAIGNIPSGGGSSYNLLYSDEVTVSTTSTTATSVKTLETGITFVVGRIYCVSIRDKAGKRDGYFYGTDNYFLMPYTPFTNSTQVYGATVAIGSDSKMKYTTSLRGVYLYRFYGGGNMGELAIRSRYDSSNTLTINGTYSIKVYEVTIPEPFE